MRAKLARVRISGAVAARRALWSWLALLWLSVDSAHAQSEADFSLVLRAPQRSGCIDGADLIAQLEARTGRTARSSNAAVRVNVQIAATDPGFRAEVSLLGSRRELLVEGPCSELDEVLVVVIASSLGVHAAAPTPREKIAWQVEPPRSAAAPAPTPGTTTAVSATRWQLAIDASARMLTGMFPRPTLGPGLTLLASWGALGLRFGGTWLPNQSHALRPEFALRVTGGLGVLGLCGRAAGESRLVALFCADLSAGAIRASGDPLWQAAPRWDAWLMLVPHAEGRLQISPVFGVALALGAAIPLLFPRYAYADRAAEQRVAHAPELGLFAELSLWLQILP